MDQARVSHHELDRRGFLRTGFVVTAAGLATRVFGTPSAEASAVFFKDSFGRAGTTHGWGKAWFNQRYAIPSGITNKRGYYSLPAPYTVPPPDRGAGDYNPNPVTAVDHDVRDVDVSSLISTSNANARFGLVVRKFSYADYYGVHVDGPNLRIARFKENTELDIQGPTPLPVAIAAGSFYWMRVKISGTKPVTIRAKIWKAGQPQPRAWTMTATDNDASKLISDAGAFGYLFMHDAVDRNPAHFKVAKFKAISAATKALTPPTVTFAYAGRTKPGSSPGTLKALLVAKTEGRAKVKFRQRVNDSHLKKSSGVPADKTLSFPRFGVAKVWSHDFRPGDTLYWQAWATGSTGAKAHGSLQSLQVPAAGSSLAFAFGSCTNFYPTSASFATAAGMAPAPAFFAHLGDFGYAQDTDSAALAIRQDCFHDRWTRMLSRSQTSALHEHSAWLMQQDDHDYGQNNMFKNSGFPEFTISAWDDISGNAYESTDHRFFDIAYGDVHGFVLNTRQYADDPAAPDGPDKSLLGSGQKQWLKDSMRAAANGGAKMLVVFATTPFWGAGVGDTTWKKAFARERSELIDFFFSLQGGGTRVLMCTGNSHAHYVNRFRNPDPTGKDLYEFVSSGTDRAMPGASADGTPILPGPADEVIDPTRARKNADGFGFISYDPTGGGTVSLRAIRSDTGRDIWAPLVLAI